MIFCGFKLDSRYCMRYYNKFADICKRNKYALNHCFKLLYAKGRIILAQFHYLRKCQELHIRKDRPHIFKLAKHIVQRRAVFSCLFRHQAYEVNLNFKLFTAPRDPATVVILLFT